MSLIAQDDLIREVYDEALEWLLDHPEADDLPLEIIQRLNAAGLDAARTELRLQMERDRSNG